MEKYQSTKISFVQKPTLAHWSSKVINICHKIELKSIANDLS
jgi:hypothetical protein